MPDRSGFDVLDDLKRDPATRGIPVIIQTSRRLREADLERLADLPIVLGDLSQLGQVFQNLIGNCIKYRSEDPVRITINAERDSAGDWLIRVCDNGISGRSSGCMVVRSSGPESGWRCAAASLKATAAGSGRSLAKVKVQRSFSL
jgi:Histidine kinase-, DNA gyrase B-, and HSP90-like ATPase